MAANLAALATTGGGVLVLGVCEPDIFVGVDKEKVRRALDRARHWLSPIPNIVLQFAEVDGQTIAAVRVDGSAKPISVRGSFFQRADAGIRSLTADEIREQILKSHGLDLDRALTELSRVVAQQSEEIVRLRSAVLRGNSMARRVWIAGVAAVCGALLRELVEHLVRSTP